MRLYSSPRDWLATVECPECRRPYRRFTLILSGDSFPCTTCGTVVAKRSDNWPGWLAAPWLMIAIIGCLALLARLNAGVLYSAMALCALAVTFPHHVTLEKTSAVDPSRDLMQYPMGRIFVFFSFGLFGLLVAFLLFRPLWVTLAVTLD